MTGQTRSCILLFLTAALLVLPVLVTANPLLTDYPNHLARAYLLDALDRSPDLSAYYERSGAFVPYFAPRILFALNAVLPLEWAGRLYTALSLLLPLLGTVLLSRVLHGRVLAVTALAAPLLFSQLLSWGFSAFLLSIGPALMGFAGWIATGSMPRMRRLLIFTGICAAVTLLHLLAGALYAFLVLGYESGRMGDAAMPVKRQLRELAVTGLQFLPLPLLFFLHSAGDHGLSATVFGSLQVRLLSLLSPFTFISADLSLATAGDWAAGLALGLALLLGLVSGIVRIDPRMHGPLRVLLIISLLWPTWMMGVAVMEIRFPLCFWLLLVAGIRIGEAPRHVVPAAAGILATLLLARVWFITGALTEASGRIQRFREAAGVIEPGARVLPVIAYGAGRSPEGFRQRTFYHASAFLVPDRQAFYPLLFSMYEVRPRPAYRAVSVPSGIPAPLKAVTGGNWPGWREHFDYLVALNIAGALPDDLHERIGGVTPLYDDGFFQILAVGENAAGTQGPGPARQSLRKETTGP